MARFHPEVPGDAMGAWLQARLAGYSESSRNPSSATVPGAGDNHTSGR